MLAFLGAVLAGGISLLYPPVVAVKAIGTFGLFIGLVLIAVAVLLELLESILARHEVGTEVGDLDEPVKQDHV